MGKYRSYGSLDDQPLVDGDTGFIGINQREQPNQLKPGEVVLSKNGRIDGYWQPRRGITLKSGTLSFSSLPLRVPAWIPDSPIVPTSAARSSNVVTLTVAGGHGLDYSAYATATLDPSGANNTILLTANTSGEGESDISAEISTNPENGNIYPGIDEIDIIPSGRHFNIRVGERSGKLKLTVSGLGFEVAANTTYTLAVEGDANTDWEWTTDGNPKGGSWGSGGTRYAIYGRPDADPYETTWYFQRENGTSIGVTAGDELQASVLPIGEDALMRPLNWPDDTRCQWQVAGPGSITVTAVKPTAQEIIDAINADSYMSELVTASAVGSATGVVDDVATTYLRGGWGATAWITLGDPANTTPPLTGTDNVVAGAYLVTCTSDTTMTFAHTGVNEALVIDGTYGYLAATIDDDAISDIWGSCVFSDPASSSAESVFLAVNSECKKIALADYSTSSIPYPSGGSITGEVDMVQAFDRVFIFNGGSRSWEYIPNGRNIKAATYTSATGIVNVTLTDHGLSVGDSITTSSIGYVTTNPNGTHTVSAIVDEDTFRYVIASGGGNETYTANTGTMTAAGFTLVPAGAYTQPQAFNIAGSGYGVAAGLVRFTVSGNTTIKAGSFITVDATDVTELQPLIGNRYEVTSADSTDIYFRAPVANFTYGTGSATEYIEFSGNFSVGGGFIHSPAPPWGVYFQRRLWCPYFYTPAGTGTSPTYADREVRDELCASDILDSTTFDAISSQFRITPGVADYLIGLHPFYDDNLVVFNRNSIHLITGTNGSLADTSVRELTREVGCLARKSIVSHENNVFFLSDSGIYGLSFVDEYNLRGIERPLSEKIQPYMDRINKSLADNSIGIYFNNRYYIAVPLDSVRGADDAKGNNTVLIYNMLNKAWESIDTYGNNDFLVSNFLIGQSEKRNDLYIVNREGGLHLCDDSPLARDIYSLDVVGNSSQAGVDYELTTRGFSFNNLERKKFKEAQVQARSDASSASDVEFLFASEDPDTSQFSVNDIATMLDPSIGLPGQLPADESGNFRFRLGNPRGIYGTLTIKRKIVGSVALGRPKITSIKLDGDETNRQTLTQY